MMRLPITFTVPMSTLSPLVGVGGVGFLPFLAFHGAQGLLPELLLQLLSGTVARHSGIVTLIARVLQQSTKTAATHKRLQLRRKDAT